MPPLYSDAEYSHLSQNFGTAAYGVPARTLPGRIPRLAVPDEVVADMTEIMVGPIWPWHKESGCTDRARVAVG